MNHSSWSATQAFDQEMDFAVSGQTRDEEVGGRGGRSLVELNRGGDRFSLLLTGASGAFRNWVWPLPIWNGRQPVISNGFNPAPDPRYGKKHGGVDIMYRRLPAEPVKLPEGSKGFFVPSNRIPVLAAGDGKVVRSARINNGYFVRIDHGNGYHTAYFHLTPDGLPAVSTPVTAGTPIGFVGHNPNGYRLNHLHFEIWPGGVHARSIDPATVLRGMANGSTTPMPTPSLSGSKATSVRQAIQQGVRDENRLTSMVFHARHPELKGRRIKPEEHQLAQEWLKIRDSLVRPALRGS